RRPRCPPPSSRWRWRPRPTKWCAGCAARRRPSSRESRTDGSSWTSAPSRRKRRPRWCGRCAMRVVERAGDGADTPRGSRPSPGRPAVFLDRDGTIVVERNYLADPARVELVPGAAAALRALAEAGYALVVVTNQSGIARGLYGEGEFRAVQRRIEELLAREGIRLDGVYHCPHHPDYTGPCECRKPAVGLYLRAARELGLDLSRSVCIGDRLKDVLPARQ